MSEPRFYVRESSGYPIRGRGPGTGAGWTTLFHIFDRAYMHREVARFGKGQDAWTRCTTNLARTRRTAERRCAELNAWDASA